MQDCNPLRASRFIIAILLLLSLLVPRQIAAQSDPNTENPELLSPTDSELMVAENLSALEEQFIDARVEQYLAQMSTADKVGQLFVVAFEGADFGIESDIAELVYLYRVGGVSISPRYLNFDNNKTTDTPLEVATLTNLLQSLSYGVLLSRAVALDSTIVPDLRGQAWPPGVFRTRAINDGGENLNASNLPLFIAVQQAGNGTPHTALIHGFTQLPSQMAIGSTWQPEMAFTVGQIVGRELNAVGANMLLGPDLNVFTQPPSEQVGQLGIGSFGRSPFWVSRMGRSYIQGIHDGSGDQLITVARHFPGQGSSDRLPNQEIATIQETVEELEAIHMAPFASVTRGDSSIAAVLGDGSMTDGLMSSHMRYGSLQGGSDTKPLSLVPLLSELFQREQFANWRPQGLLMSDELGSPAVRRYYDATVSSFPVRDVALSAFEAGHDLLYLSQFSMDNTWEAEKENIIKTITHFQERYDSDSDFAARVDQSVRRILRVKLRMYIPSQTERFQAQIEPVDIEASDVITDMDDLAFDTDNATPALGTDIPLQSTTPVTATETITATFTHALEETYHVSLTQAISLPLVLAVEEDLTLFEEPNQDAPNAVIKEVAQSSLTLLYPSLMEELPQPPQIDEQVLIVTNNGLVKECETCTADVVGPETLKDRIIELYGPEARGLIEAEQIDTIGFSDLAEYFDKKAKADSATAEGEDSESEGDSDSSAEVAEPTPKEVQEAITDGESAESVSDAGIDESEVLQRMEQRFDEADWVVFVMLDVVTDVPSSNAVKRFLGTDGELLRNADKRVVVFALNAPYFLDATEVSQLSAYFGVNSRTELFIENAVSGLFQSETPRGAPVYNVPGTIYTNLFDRLKPDPEGTIPLQIFAEEELLGQLPLPDDDEEVEPIVAQNAQTLRLQAGPIIDKNGHVVPDDTPIEFQAVSDSGESILSSEPVFTRNGRASRTVQFSREGRIQISAFSDPANSDVLEIFVQPPEQTDAATEPSATDSGASTDGTPSIEEDSAGEEDGAGEAETAPPVLADPQVVRSPNIFTLIVALLTILVMLSLLLILQVHVIPRPYLVQNMLWAMIVGLFAYILYSGYLLFTGTRMTLQVSLFGTAIVVFLSMLIPLLWLQLREE